MCCLPAAIRYGVSGPDEVFRNKTSGMVQSWNKFCFTGAVQLHSIDSKCHMDPCTGIHASMNNATCIHEQCRMLSCTRRHASMDNPHGSIDKATCIHERDHMHKSARPHAINPVNPELTAPPAPCNPLTLPLQVVT
mgnify:CR=1 FL=1